MTEVFERSEELGRDYLAVDWEASSLGPVESWPQSLRSAVRLMLASRFPMFMLWGEELGFLFNDSYRRTTLGKKYPWAMAQPFAVVWAEVWDEVGPMIHRVMATGEATWDESLLLFLERSGYTEETYHTFSYSPVFDDDGRIAGVLCVVKEDTEEVIARRRMQTLRDLGACRSPKLSEAETVDLVCRELQSSQPDVPFALVYLFDEDGTTARLSGSTGFPAGHPGAPAELSLSDPEPVWPAAEALAGRTVQVDDLPTRLCDLPTGVWDLPPGRASSSRLPPARRPRRTASRCSA